MKAIPYLIGLLVLGLLIILVLAYNEPSPKRLTPAEKDSAIDEFSNSLIYPSKTVVTY